MGILDEQKFENTPEEGCPAKEISNQIISKEIFEIPDFVIPYKLQGRHPNATRCSRESHEWLATHGVDKQLGPEIWKGVEKHNTPDVMSHILPDVPLKEFLVVSKYILCLYSLDTLLDDTPIGKDIDKSLSVILEVITVLLWEYPEDRTLLECLAPLYNLVSSETSKQSVEVFKSRLVQAKLHAACDLSLSPVGSAWRDFWADYQSYCLPYDYNVRLAQGLLEWLTSCFEEVHYRSSDTTPGLVEYISFRRKCSAVKPAIVVIDLAISAFSPGIPNSLFYSPPMQRLLIAITDLVSWHNDVFSVYKECIVNNDKHNLVYIISKEQGCSLTKAAGEFVMKMLNDRMTDMESAITDLSSAASADLHTAVEEYAKCCRNWVSGSHAWHAKSIRYKALRNTFNLAVDHYLADEALEL